MAGGCVAGWDGVTIAAPAGAGEARESGAAIRESGDKAPPAQGVAPGSLEAEARRGADYLPVLMVFQMRVRRRSIFCGMDSRANSLAIFSCGG
ncbi:hypothetical protein SAMN05216272_104235 [Pseudomonas panipatensis]|uniref:Uncharacterized protein n=1 Tax=Pseudomonas panipatensis TaxID=428992 RepID=A0A1G8GFX5_9PSED|nr:hypothetical protein SAMN05216272_104235 [Pseudomonas panipatensis]SMP43473.1 hypothetical protein SAMN06295951_101749 [Pseudomonas panipatensis]